MPTYEYRCLACGKVFSVVQGIKEERLTVHEGCGGELERLISGGRLMLTERKSGRPEPGDFSDSPAEWEDHPYGDMGEMGGGLGDIPGGMGDEDAFGGTEGNDEMGDLEDLE